MTKFTINKIRTSLPLSAIKGTQQERMQKAIGLNLQFYEKLHDKFVQREVKTSKFKTTLKDTAGGQIGVEVFNTEPNSSKLSLLIGAKNKIRGFGLYLPHNIWGECIRQSSAKNFLKITQSFFNEICNPKFLARNIYINNHIKDTNAVSDFYAQNISGKNVLTQESLDNFLQNRKADDKINILQFFRYNLFSERNTKQAEPQIDKQFEKLDNITYVNKKYDLKDFSFDEKLALLCDQLKSVIQTERQK